MSYIWLIISIVSAIAMALFFKAGMLRVGQSPQNLMKLPRFLLRTITNRFVILAIISFILFVVFNSFALSKLPLSYIKPLQVGIPMFFITFFASLFFREKVNRLRWLGIVTIFVGITIFGMFES